MGTLKDPCKVCGKKIKVIFVNGKAAFLKCEGCGGVWDFKPKKEVEVGD